MTLRIHPFLLSFALLVGLNACSTTRPGPAGETSAGQVLPPQAGTRDSERQYNTSLDGYAHSLTKAAVLSRSLSYYQSDVALEILHSLESVPSSHLNTVIDSQQNDRELDEWLELSLQVRTLLINGRSITASAHEWVNDHPEHIIHKTNFLELVSRYSTLFPVPPQVAILLPTEGSLAGAAKAIRDGIVSAYLEQPGQSVLHFYSSGKNTESAIAAYLQALADGATQIVGPLRIESTRALASLEGLSVPILLLNELPNNPGKFDQTTMLTSLSLSQAEEVAAIASAALAQGQKQALVIVPNTAWGTRMETAFATVFEQGEGHISASTRFNTATSDHSATLTQLLEIDKSNQRKADLQSRLGIPLTFEPSHRDDFDFIFLAADPLEGRELKPLLRFHDAGDVPVYAVSRIFSGKKERASDQDLNGIIFPATPWQLNATGDSPLTLDSVRGGVYGNLYALGQDAWHLLRWLPLMQKDPDLWFPGDVGALRLQPNGRLYRQPTWAKISAGRPIPYQWPHRQPSSGSGSGSNTLNTVD